MTRHAMNKGWVFLLALVAAVCQQSPSKDRIPISSVGFSYVGGQNIERLATGIFGDTNDQIRAYQIAVLSLAPATDKAKAPVVMLPGFGHCGGTYLETPDGRNNCVPGTRTLMDSRSTRTDANMRIYEVRFHAAVLQGP